MRLKITAVEAAFLVAISLLISRGADCVSLDFTNEGSHKNPFRSPGGAMNIDITPMINQEKTPAIPGCAAVQFKKSDVVQDPMLWPWSGLKRLTRIVYEEYLKQKKINGHTLRYKDKIENGRTTKRRLGEAPNHEAVRKIATECIARRLALNEFPMGQAICSCLSSQDDQGYCQFSDVFALDANCYDNMATHINKVEVCPSLLTKSLGVNMSQMCSGHIAGTISPLNFDLYSLNFPGPTPDQIESKIANQEGRAYYVALKAIEKLSRWTDAHLFCAAEQPDHSNLKDLDLLPSWKPQMYFWIVEPSGRRLPIAVLAQRMPEGCITDCPKSVENTVLVIRNMRTTFEGGLFLSSQHTRKFLLADVGPVHEGYDAVAFMIIPPLVRFFSKFFATAIPSRPKITTIGHGNFGAGVGSIIARDLANKFSIAPNSHATIEHNLIAIEGGPVGSYEFTSELRSKVNVRNIVSDRSGFSQIPCETVRGCDTDYQVITGYVGQKFGPYLNLPGRVTVDSYHLADSVWRTNATGLETVAHLNCAASCWLASTFCRDDLNPRCSYSQCGGFFTKESRLADEI